jgi:hypothetical protein
MDNYPGPIQAIYMPAFLGSENGFKVREIAEETEPRSFIMAGPYKGSIAFCNDRSLTRKVISD